MNARDGKPCLSAPSFKALVAEDISELQGGAGYFFLKKMNKSCVRQTPLNGDPQIYGLEKKPMRLRLSSFI